MYPAEAPFCPFRGQAGLEGRGAWPVLDDLCASDLNFDNIIGLRRRRGGGWGPLCETKVVRGEAHVHPSKICAYSVCRYERVMVVHFLLMDDLPFCEVSVWLSLIKEGKCTSKPSEGPMWVKVVVQGATDN